MYAFYFDKDSSGMAQVCSFIRVPYHFKVSLYDGLGMAVAIDGTYLRGMVVLWKSKQKLT